MTAGLLWGGVGVFLSVIYLGVYLWMRRPSFGDNSGRSSPRQEAGPSASQPPAPAPFGSGPASASRVDPLE